MDWMREEMEDVIDDIFGSGWFVVCCSLLLVRSGKVRCVELVRLWFWWM